MMKISVFPNPVSEFILGTGRGSNSNTAVSGKSPFYFLSACNTKATEICT